MVFRHPFNVSAKAVSRARASDGERVDTQARLARQIAQRFVVDHARLHMAASERAGSGVRPSSKASISGFPSPFFSSSLQHGKVLIAGRGSFYAEAAPFHDGFQDLPRPWRRSSRGFSRKIGKTPAPRCRRGNQHKAADWPVPVCSRSSPGVRIPVRSCRSMPGGENAVALAQHAQGFCEINIRRLRLR